MSRQRGRPSNNRLPADRPSAIEDLLRGKYEGFGPMLAAEKLGAMEGVAVSSQTLRQMQIGLGLWRPKARVFRLRERRPRFGELIQINGSPHENTIDLRLDRIVAAQRTAAFRALEVRPG